MRKHTIIEHQQFKQITQYKPIAEGKQARKDIKYRLLDSIKDVLGEKWYRIKEETRQAFDYLCFLAIERGFVYAGSQHVGKRHQIDSSTIRRYMSFLEKEGVIKRLWRSSSRHNGRGKAVVFFTVHPYYKKYWQQKFFLHDNAQQNAQA